MRLKDKKYLRHWHVVEVVLAVKDELRYVRFVDRGYEVFQDQRSQAIDEVLLCQVKKRKGAVGIDGSSSGVNEPEMNGNTITSTQHRGPYSSKASKAPTVVSSILTGSSSGKLP